MACQGEPGAQEATELADLFQKVDAVFASGNHQRIASLLATMRRSISLVGSVPEFQGSKEKLDVSEYFMTFWKTVPSQMRKKGLERPFQTEIARHNLCKASKCIEEGCVGVCEKLCV